ncbi:MAG: hypothetical protein LBF68_00175 [Christensenellaceae bacterium]|jgi:hypothetical protein|nr:hypothetical protein [Christensenellaceae bacterium]
MIFKIQKALHKLDADYPLTTNAGDPICKISRFRNSFVVSNSRDQQIAKMSYAQNSASISVSHVLTDSPAVIIVDRDRNGKFYVSRENNASENARFSLHIPEITTNGNITVWGNPNQYSFDIYEGPDLSASIVPLLDDEKYYMINLSDTANLLQMLLIVISMEALNSIPS